MKKSTVPFSLSVNETNYYKKNTQKTKNTQITLKTSTSYNNTEKMDKLVKKYYALSPLDQKRPVEIRPRNRYNGASTPDATSGRTERPTPIYKRQALAYGVAS